MARYSFLKALFMKILTDKGKLTGYEFIKFCKEKGFNVSPGSVYPLLSDLARKGLIRCEKEGRRKVYYLTEEGKRFSEEIKNAKRVLHETMKRLGISVESENYPSFVKEHMNKILAILKMIDWKKEEEIDALLNSLEEFQEDLRRWKDGLRDRG